jgi:hypothetical protein
LSEIKFLSNKKFFVNKRNLGKKILIFTTLIAGLFFARFVLAQDFGIDVVGNSLNNSLGATGSDPRAVASRIINFALGFLGIVALFIILYGGFKWMTSGGSEEKVSEAKKILTAGVIGLIIVLASWGIASFLISRLSGAVNGGPGGGCTDGDSYSCGCGGSMVCSGGSFGACVGSDCSGCHGAGCGPSSCDSSANPGCQASDQICGAGNICNESCVCEPQSEAGEACDSDTTNSSCDADNNLCGSYLTCNPDTCLCGGSPVITGISPVGGFCQNEQNRSCSSDSDCSDTCNLTAPNGAANNFLTIFGKNFGEYSATSSKVIFVGSGSEREGRNPIELNSACLSFWRDDQIVIAIPSGAATGPIKVVTRDNLSDTTGDNYGPVTPDFRSNSIVRPGLCSLNPNSGLLSSAVSYAGVNLYAGDAYFGNYERNVQALSSNFNDIEGLVGTSTTPNIKAGESGSFVKATLNGNSENSNYLLFVKEKEAGEGPFISSFTPTSGNTGQYVTIYGSGFGGAQGDSKVFFGDVEASYDFPEVCLNSVWKDNQIMVKVPETLSDGNFVIKVVLGDKTIDTQELNPNALEFNKNLDLKTSLCKIDPTRGPLGTPVSLWGEYFGTVGHESSIKFNGASTNVTSTIELDGRADKLETTVPAGSITGPVRVLKDSVYGNELNFAVGDCVTNSDCGAQVCCPKNTFKNGRCVATLDACYVDVPSSVFEWSFSSAFASTTDDADSCAGLAKYTGACNIGSCPNVPGTCSPYAGGGKILSSNCSYDCSNVSGCKIGESRCSYNTATDKCLQILESGATSNCDLPKNFDYTLNGKTLSAPGSCNQNNHWEITIPSSCPTGFTHGDGNKCVDLSSQCALCANGLSCEEIGGVGRCASANLCPSSNVCEDIPDTPTDRCVFTKAASCDCCCTIGESARDCCAYENKTGSVVQLECGGTCGTDTTDDQSGLGKCGGCAAAGDTAAERDAACNCSGHNNQYCEINSEFPAGFCTDCSSLSATSCTDHSNFCCLDANKTASTTDDICRGGAGNLIGSDPGYCAYYKCSETTASECASSTPVKIGNYKTAASCGESCGNADPCSALTDQAACNSEVSGRCCFDAKNSKCRLGTAISGGAPEDNGYCAYFNCEPLALGATEKAECASTTPLKSGAYKTVGECNTGCPNPPSGAGLSCVNQSSKVCDTSICNYPGFACLNLGGQMTAGNTSDCGICCCQPVTVPGALDSCKGINDVLSCVANKGNCTEDKRGLCCGCLSDDQCGSTDFVGCGADTCCDARPNIASSSPAHLADKVCRNALLKISFNKLMDFESLSANVVLVEEKDYGDGICPSGNLLAKADSVDQIWAGANRNVFAVLKDKLFGSFRKIAGLFFGSSNQALANPPSASKLYCSIPGTAYLENTTQASVVSFAPQTILAPATNYYLIVKGDEDLNSRTGVLSVSKIGFNGQGYFDGAGMTGSSTEGELLSFNNRKYKNSAIIKFSTLSAQGEMAGICSVSDVSLAPISYLFKTTDNALESDEKDVPGSNNFDVKADRDKVFTAQALSADKQALRPVTGYYFDYDFSIIDSSIASGSHLTGLPLNQLFVEAQKGITDGATKIKATIKMDRFDTNKGACDDSTGCICAAANCSNNCCNYSLNGDGFNKFGDIYVFLCNNPWPMVDAYGNWSPWKDAANNCTVSSADCSNYNYKFYYCRDTGAANTSDDLPAIISPPVIKGIALPPANNLICSSDKNITCSSANTACGADRDGNGFPDGICIWNVLKESYFFREQLPSAGEITAWTDLRTGGAIKLDWHSNSDQVASYKIYYLKSGKGDMFSQEVQAADACTLSGQIYNCSSIISGLTNKVNYVFKIGVVSVNKAESAGANEQIAMATDGTAPSVPTGLTAEIIASSSLKITWNENTNDTSFYRLYRSVMPGVYGESYDSAKNTATIKIRSLSFTPAQLSAGNNYFALTAIDGNGNESAKSAVLVFDVPAEFLNN